MVGKLQSFAEGRPRSRATRRDLAASTQREFRASGGGRVIASHAARRSRCRRWNGFGWDRSGRRGFGYGYLKRDETNASPRVRRPGGKKLARGVAMVVASLALIVLACPVAQAQVDAATVQRAIDRGVDYLRKTQNARGGWQEYGGQSCGLSALCTLAMLNCGVSRDDPDMVEAMRYLRSFQPSETYSVALQTLVYCQLGAAGDLPRIRRNVQWLIRNQKTAGRNVGSWDYGEGVGAGDESNTQFAVLALGAAQDRGIAVESNVFARALDYWVERQQNNGGWSYRSRPQATGSMTCAGVASVIIARGRLGDSSSSIQGDAIRCCGNLDEENDPVEQGLEWLGRNFSLQVNPGGDKFTFFYYLYALERVGRLSGQRFIGQHDWYREGSQRLVELQDQFSGFWPGAEPMETRDVATSFALLFLSKGKRQVVVGQLKHGVQAGAAPWQKHPDALRQLVRHVEQDWRRDLTWQTVDVQTARLQDLLQTPVLVISGEETLRFDDTTSDRLLEYVNQGGCILFDANAGDGCGDARAFEQSVRTLCSEWFEGAKLERLPPTHPIWFAEHKVDPMAIGEDYWVEGVQACCRTAVFYSPRSLSCRWELGDVLFHRDRGSPPARRQVEAGIRLGQNLIAYATGRELKDKLEQAMVLAGSTESEPERGAIQLAMLGLDAGGQEARRALPNAAALIGARVPIEITALEGSVGFDPETLQDVPFLWIHGRTEFTFTASQRDVLRQYVETGGIILASAVCGSEAFADAFRREMAEILPDAPLRTLPGDHPALNVFGGFDIRSVTIRQPATGESGVNKRSAPPLLEMATVDDVASVFFSPLDLSCALESPNSIQCPGYNTEDAAKIVANLVLYALQQ